MAAYSRSFDLAPARRGNSHLMIGIVGPSSSGKTKSALRLADGIARVDPGMIAVIDTEAGRAAHHAGEHTFHHLQFAPPFGPLDYIAAMQTCIDKGARTIIVDSMSHEHEGLGGVLEQHEAELDRIAGQDWKKRERCNQMAWIRPKAAHKKMKHFILQQRVNFIVCFRAQEKIKPEAGGAPVNLGWSPIGAADLIFEMLIKCLLYPGADGRPEWKSDRMGEVAMMKLPQWFREIFSTRPQLSEDIGEQLARWAAGGDVAPARPATPAPSNLAARAAHLFVSQFDSLTTEEAFADLEEVVRAGWEGLTTEHRRDIKAARERAIARLKGDA